ncbi:DUF1003 domain-containing protein [Niabella hibiscisoli]|uniref:DUF1003 domain-containing protein n=1 Tax=Niabella hibiscisoli TaxID=1825928 RepID=UPI001F114738|nr:DUF1003 domain-containing protein [Niabella hibiscisoli]MCH5720891.1 DUF1003 domain-containing protein [Niabella hibiscisoli]
MKTFRSDVSGKEFPVAEKVAGSSLNDRIIDLIRQEMPEFTVAHFLSVNELKSYREKYIIRQLSAQTGKNTNLVKNVMDSITGDTILADAIEEENKTESTLGQRVADKVASFGGSWTFIISFIIFLLVWIAFNAFILLNKGFDPYPFILLNLILSCLAALQAPVIMMSQNRQEEKDRERAKKDYMINLKAELEIKLLHEKMDRLINLESKLTGLIARNDNTAADNSATQNV